MIEHLSLSASKPEWGESSSHLVSQSVRHVTSHHTFIGIDCESCSTHHHPQITSSTSFRDTLWLMLGWWKEQIAPHKLHLILSACLTPRRWWGWGHDQEQNWAMDDKFTSQSSGWDPRHIHTYHGTEKDAAGALWGIPENSKGRSKVGHTNSV